MHGVVGILQGLSPRLRGNHLTCEPGSPGARSIPAPAGEPSWRVVMPNKTKVYPRACGGTWRPLRRCSPVRGLSPRLRGNRRGTPAKSARPGSIPAPAGEPGSVRGLYCTIQVYPRACGGTTFSVPRTKSVEGLSPRLRGNLYDDDPDAIEARSIPAPAGEPNLNTVSAGSTTVYPRACGGT